MPEIINCGGIVFVTTPFPHGVVSDLIPSWAEQARLGVDVDLRATNDNEYFVVVISGQFTVGQPDPTPEMLCDRTREVLQHVWDQMVEREIVTGDMPEIIKGNPVDMTMRQRA